MSNTLQARTPTKNASGEAPVRHWLLSSHRDAFAVDSSPPSRTNALQLKPPHSKGSQSTRQQRSRLVKNDAVKSPAPSDSICFFASGQHIDANEREDDALGADTTAFTYPPERASQSFDEDAAPAQCVSAVVASQRETEGCGPTKREPQEQRHPTESSALRSASLLERAEAGVDATQTRGWSHMWAHKRAVLLSCPFHLPSPPPSGEHAHDVAGGIGAKDPAKVPSAVVLKNASGQRMGDHAAVNMNDLGTDCALASLPAAPCGPLQARFFRSLKLLWQDAREPHEAVTAADNDRSSADTDENCSDANQPCGDARVLHEVVGPYVHPPPAPHIRENTTLQEKEDEEENGVGGEDGAFSGQRNRLDRQNTVVVACEQSQADTSLESLPLPAVPVLPQINAVLCAVGELSTVAATVSPEGSRGSLASPPIPPCADCGVESSVDGTPLPHVDTANPSALQSGGPGGVGGDGMRGVEPHTPDAVRGGPPRRLQSASPSLQESGKVINISSPAGLPDSRKRVSPLSGRGTSSSYGCSDGGSTLESRQARRPALSCDTDEEDDGHRSFVSRNLARPLEEGAQEAEKPHCRLAAAECVGLPGACLCNSNPTVASGAVLLRYSTPKARPSHVQADKPCCSRKDDWKSALEASHALLAEYQLSVLTAFMTARKAAFLPSRALCRLAHVNTRTHTPASAAEEAPVVEPAVSEVRLLFHLYRTSPSDSAADGLFETFFAMQLTRYVNWVHHLEFEYLYVRMVALRAVPMMEVHERRLICMRRDLGIRDAIEMFMLLAPRPHTPTASTKRRIFSSFRIALHALTGGGDGDARAKAASAKRSGSCSTRTQHKSSLSPALLSATVCHLTAEEERRQHLPPRIEPLFASECCNAARPTTPVIYVINAGSIGGRATCDANATASPVAHGGGAGYTEVLYAAREAVGVANLTCKKVERHCGTPRPPNETCSSYSQRVGTSNDGGAAASTLSGLWLPKLTRSAWCSISAVNKTAEETATSANDSGLSHMQRRGEDDCTRRNTRSLPSSLSQQRREHNRLKKGDIELPDGRLCAKERVQPKKRHRTPQQQPTDADFVDLHNAEVLQRFVK
ncbi:hypothetical protein LSCM4_05359 [Leishmania orientalis]|uniref:Uncharacterized protein n=1 Tax=Leishmania orientalis TaxID=2249476 RepID=A0A836KJC1_9TRYP|nr:hypothetical protein LSCM4_05359 [Leishmania orientalis]